MKPMIINHIATIQEGALKGISGKVVGFDSIKDVVIIQVDEFTFIETHSENTTQESNQSQEEENKIQEKPKPKHIIEGKVIGYNSLEEG